MAAHARLKAVLATLVAGPTLAAALVVGGATPAGAATLNFTTPGEHEFVVPAGNTTIRVVAVGGSGGRSSRDAGGAGGKVSGDIAVTAGQRLYFVVGGNGTGRFEGVNPGQGGANGGGAGGSGSGGGGGASDVRTCRQADTSCNSLASRLLIAAGGGGMGNGNTAGAGAGGSAGGGPGVAGPVGGIGSPGLAGGGEIVGTDPPRGGQGGGGGTLAAGGAGGADDIGGVAASGSLGAGGAAQAEQFGNMGGGGGGGYFGGGAGGRSLNQGNGGGGGGGSSFAAAGVTNVSFATDTTRSPGILVTFNAAPANTAPVAVNDQYTTAEDGALNVVAPGVLGNDSDAEGGALSAVVVTAPAHGDLTLGLDGRVLYRPAPNYSGPDAFTYKARDAAGAESAPATVSLTVNPVNDAPTGVNDTATTQEDTPVDIPVLDNDTDIDSPNSDLRLLGAAVTTNGTASVLPDGRTLRYTPKPDLNSSTTEVFRVSYRLTDGAASGAGIVDITVTPVNDAPVAGDDAFSLDEDTQRSGNVLGNDSDVDGPSLGAVLVSGPAHAASFSLNGQGAFAYQPAPDFYGQDSFTYKAVDGAGGESAVATVRLTVDRVDDIPPTLLLPAPITVDAAGSTGGAVVSYTASATDEAPASPAVTCTPASGSTFAIGTTTVNCSATDAAGNTGTGSFTVTVRDILPPALSVPAPITVDAAGTTGGAPVSFTVTAADDNPANRNPAVTCTPASGTVFAIGSHTVNCSSTDAAGNTGTGSFTVTVRDVLPPVLSLPAPVAVNAVGTTGEAPVTYTATATDDDRRAPSPAVTCTPASGSVFPIGTTTVNCSSTDLSGNTGTGSFTVQVVDILPPVVTAPSGITVNATDPAGAVVPFTATAVDDDRRAPTPAVTCTPAAGTTFAIGDTTVTCTATDLSGNVGRASFTVHVKGAAEQLADTVAASKGVGPGQAVSSMIERAQAEFAAGKVDKACKTLEDYKHQLEVHSPKAIPTALATRLAADASRIQDVMDC